MAAKVTDKSVFKILRCGVIRLLWLQVLMVGVLSAHAQVGVNRNLSQSNLVPPALNNMRNASGNGINSTPTSGNYSYPSSNNEESSDTSSQEPTARGIEYHVDIPDSTLLGGTYIFHYRPHCTKIEQISYPSFSASSVQNFDPLEAINGNFYLSKGTLGQAHYATYPMFEAFRAWRYQPDIMAGYSKTPTSVRFFQAQRPYTTLTYQSSLKSEYLVRASHTQNIMPRWNVSFDVDFYNPDAIYANSDVKNTMLDITSNYYSADARYQVYFGYILQKYRMGENGGLMDDAYFTDNASQSNLSGLPVVSNTLRSNMVQHQLFTHHTYSLVREIPTPRQRYRVEVSADDSNMLDTIYWTDTLPAHAFKVFNAGVLGLDADLDMWKRVCVDSIQTNRFSAQFYWTNDAYHDSRWHNPLKITLGIQPQLVRVNERDSIFSTFTTISPFARVVQTMGTSSFSAQVQYAIGDNYMNGDGEALLGWSMPLDSVRTIQVQASYQSRAADYFYHHYHCAGLLWDMASLRKTDVLRVAAHYEHTSMLQLELAANRVAHAVWISPNLSPTQADGSAWLFQFKMEHHSKLWGWLCYDMQQLVQYSTDPDQIRVPTWSSKNSLYTDVVVFKNALTLQVGLDVRYFTRFLADGYISELGAFVRQDDVKIGNYLWGDFFVNLQLKRAIIYAKLGHLNSFWETNPNYFTLPHYPGNKFGFYYGVTWKFFD
ncbi:MAG: hypothetical protein KBT04_06370 [Bacteroidales bacterium]|nr:hypothetical protein [Candidatus Colimorpha onthohippi]